LNYKINIALIAKKFIKNGNLDISLKKQKHIAGDDSGVNS